MRIISQDGTIDIPYEQCVIQRFKEKIYFLNKNLVGVEQLVNDMNIAEYSTEAKAQKAMEMLRNEYLNFMAEATPDGNGFCFNPPKVFQFPKDEDVEVENET